MILVFFSAEVWSLELMWVAGERPSRAFSFIIRIILKNLGDQGSKALQSFLLGCGHDVDSIFMFSMRSFTRQMDTLKLRRLAAIAFGRYGSLGCWVVEMTINMYIDILGGGFKYFVCSPLGFHDPIWLEHIFWDGVGSTTNSICMSLSVCLCI